MMTKQMEKFRTFISKLFSGNFTEMFLIKNYQNISTKNLNEIKKKQIE